MARVEFEKYMDRSAVGSVLIWASGARALTGLCILDIDQSW
jgi:hypothetical protein